MHKASAWPRLKKFGLAPLHSNSIRTNKNQVQMLIIIRIIFCEDFKKPVWKRSKVKASKSFSHVLGNPHLVSLGAFVQINNLWLGLKYVFLSCISYVESCFCYFNQIVQQVVFNGSGVGLLRTVMSLNLSTALRQAALNSRSSQIKHPLVLP